MRGPGADVAELGAADLRCEPTDSEPTDSSVAGGMCVPDTCIRCFSRTLGDQTEHGYKLVSGNVRCVVR